MHPTADTLLVIFGNVLGRRVMPGVRLLVRYKNSANRMRGRGGWRKILIQVLPAMLDGLSSGQAGGARQEAGCMSPFTGRAAWRALKVTQSNKRMHATADTQAVIFLQSLRAACDARR